MMGDYAWFPQEGRQTLAFLSPMDMTFYGGERGGGKTDAALGRHLAGLERWGSAWNGLLIRYRFKHLLEVKRRLRELKEAGAPIRLQGGEEQSMRVIGRDGGRVLITAVESPVKLGSFQGHQYTEVTIDEAPVFPFLEQVIDELRATLRSPRGVPARMFLNGNPGGPGHPTVTKMFRILENPRGLEPIDMGNRQTGVFIPSSTEDNVILMKNDPGYRARLESIRDENLRRAWRYGDWTVVAGGFFSGDFDASRHIVPKVVPSGRLARLMGFDWGSARPFCVLWGAVMDGNKIAGVQKVMPRGSILVFREWYGAAKGQSNVGLRLDADDVRQGIVEREEKMGERGRVYDRGADPSIFKRDGGPSIAEKMNPKGRAGIPFRPADNSRIPGWDEIRSRLRGNAEGDPMLYFTEDCRGLISTISVIPRDESNWEDVDTDAEDHAEDALRYMVMLRPRVKKSGAERMESRSQDQYRPFDKIAGY